MRIAVIGSRKVLDFEPVKEAIEKSSFFRKGIMEIITGGAIGVDSSAEKWAAENNKPVFVFLPDYKLFGKKAPLVRNIEIISRADGVVAVWDGKSKGTKFAIEYAEKRGLKVEVSKPKLY
jgi:hypothetical protein